MKLSQLSPHMDVEATALLFHLINISGRGTALRDYMLKR